MYIHVVNQNETIYSIAQMHGVTENIIAAVNNLYDLPYLVVGQALLILVPKKTYTVQSGDTLDKIARMNGISLSELIMQNANLTVNSTVYPGQTIVLEYTDDAQKNIQIYGYVYPRVSDQVILRALPYATACAIFGYGFREDGSLITIDDSPLIKKCYANSTAPYMLLTSLTQDGNFGGSLSAKMFNDLALQNKVISNCIETMKRKGYMGIDLDFEYVNSEDRDAYLEFVRNTVSMMHKEGFSVNVDLAPKTSASQPGTLYEGHDYAALGAVADTVLIMTYEWGYTYGPPMAVAPADKVEKVVEYAVSEIDNRKIFMGIPNYAYDWQLPFVKGSTRARGIGNEDAIRIAARYGSQIEYDDTAKSPYFEYYAEDGTKHVVWFEDVRSIAEKFKIIDKYNLRGGGYWNFMRPFVQNFMYIGSQYNISKII